MLAKQVKRSASWLQFGDEHFTGNVSPAPEVRARVPLISSVAAGKFCDSEDPFPPGVADVWINASINVGSRAYALTVDGDSMEGLGDISFPDGCTIVVDPDCQPKHRSFVIVRLQGTAETTFKQLIIEGDRQYLKPLNTRYPIIEFTEEAVVCGVVREMIMSRKFD